MKSIASLVVITSAMLLNACACKPPDDPEVARKCTPVTSLLSKNLRASSQADVPWLFNLGGLFDRTGAVLDPADAARVSAIDTVCRAWVKGAVKDVDYGRFILDNASAAIVQTTAPDDRPTVVEVVMKALADLRARGALPPAFDPASVPGQVSSDSQLTQQQLQAKLNTSLSDLQGRLDSTNQNADARQAQLMSRFDSLERRLAKLEPADPSASTPLGSPPAQVVGNPKPLSNDGSRTGVPADPILHALDVYFATGSSELLFSEKQRIETASQGWKQSKSIIYVMGYADPRGASTGNARLARARAQRVADLLLTLNVAVGAVSGGGVAAGADNDALRYVHLRSVSP